MEKQKKGYPEEFIGMYGKRYKLIQEYKYYGLYETKAGFKVCFNHDGIRREMTLKRKC